MRRYSIRHQLVLQSAAAVLPVVLLYSSKFNIFT
jgi:hypothetical protein